MNKTQIDLSTFIKEILQYPTDKIDHETLKQLKRKFSQQHKLSTVISNVELLASYRKMIHE
jgi:histone acetyltransferase (RNA polymerase elongator complex component)